ncbi:Protein skinhead-1, partial [Toxocara canis]
CSYSSGSIHREERSLSEATVTSARLPPHLVGSLSPSQHESDRASRRQHHSSRSSANSDRIERIESEVRGPGRRSRDEELARQYALPVSAAQIASMPLSELNRMMQSAHLTQTQQNLVRKIRRRG